MTPDANWYPDPERPGLRWWDGSTWTEHHIEAPAPPALPAATVRPKAPAPAEGAESEAPGGAVENVDNPGPPPSAGARPPLADEKNFEVCATADEGRPAPALTPAPDPQEMYRKMAADPGTWTRQLPDPSPMSAPPTRGAKVAGVIFLIFVAGLIASVFHIGGSDQSSKASAPTASESYEEKYEAAHDAVCEHTPWKYEAECQ
jgi:hypothetical protein